MLKIQMLIAHRQGEESGLGKTVHVGKLKEIYKSLFMCGLLTTLRLKPKNPNRNFSSKVLQDVATNTD
jgi:hypothetical protein